MPRTRKCMYKKFSPMLFFSSLKPRALFNFMSLLLYTLTRCTSIPALRACYRIEQNNLSARTVGEMIWVFTSLIPLIFICSWFKIFALEEADIYNFKTDCSFIICRRSKWRKHMTPALLVMKLNHFGRTDLAFWI